MPKKYKYTRAWFVKSEIKNNILKILNAKKTTSYIRNWLL